MKSDATTVAGYLAGVPDDRRAAIKAVRAVVNKHLPKGYTEGIGYGMIVWSVPLEVYPDTYNGQPLMFAALASQKNHMAVYLCSVYGDPAVRARFEALWAKSGKKLDMGQSCVRFRKLENLPLEAIGQVVGRVTPEKYIAHYEASREQNRR